MYTNDALFHLVDHQADWARWWSLKHDKPLGDVWEDAEAHPDNTLEWNPRERNLRLARQTIQFVATNEQPPISLDNRRGAGRDRYGVWYWIDDDNTGIQALSVYENDPITFWTSVEDDDFLTHQRLKNTASAITHDSAPPVWRRYNRRSILSTHLTKAA